MNLGVTFDESQQLIQDTARAFASARVAPGAAARDRDHVFPVDLVREMGALGLLGVKVPAAVGGTGADLTSYVLALAEVSRACAATGVTMAVCNMVADLVARYGTPAQHAAYLQPLLDGTGGPASFALSEPGSGSDAAGLAATAVPDGDGWVLNGAKQWITNGTHAAFHLVFARTPPAASQASRNGDPITCFVVPAGVAGVDATRTERKMGLRASNTAQLHLTDVRLPGDAVLGDVGRGYALALSGLEGGRIGIAAQAIGIAEAAFVEGVRYAKERRAFGKAVAEHQASQMAIADARLEIDAAWLLTLRAAAWKDTGAPGTASASSMAKLWASETACRVADRMLQLHGGYGYVEDFAIERLYRDARVTRIYEGTSEVQRIVIARELLRG